MVPKLSMSLMQASCGAGLFCHSAFPCLGAQTRPMENESWRRGLVIMQPPFICKKRQPIKGCCRRMGIIWRGDATEVEHLGWTLHVILAIKLSDQKDSKNISWHKGKQKNKIHNNKCRQWWWGDKETRSHLDKMDGEVIFPSFGTANRVTQKYQ